MLHEKKNQKKNSATLNQGGMLENDSKLNPIGSYLVGVLNIYLFYFVIIYWVVSFLLSFP